MHNTNNKTRETLSRLRNNHPALINSNKNPYVRETDHIEINAWFGLMYLRGLLGMNLQRVDWRTLCLRSNHVKKSIQVSP